MANKVKAAILKKRKKRRESIKTDYGVQIISSGMPSQIYTSPEGASTRQAPGPVHTKPKFSLLGGQSSGLLSAIAT